MLKTFPKPLEKVDMDKRDWLKLVNQKRFVFLTIIIADRAIIRIINSLLINKGYTNLLLVNMDILLNRLNILWEISNREMLNMETLNMFRMDTLLKPQPLMVIKLLRLEFLRDKMKFSLIPILIRLSCLILIKRLLIIGNS